MKKEIDPRSKSFEPRGGALALMFDRSNEVLIEGPSGTGKSRAVLEKANIAACNYPGARILLIRKTRKSLTDSVLVTFEEKVLKSDSGLKLGPSRQMRQVYRYPNGSEIVIGGMDNADKIMSTEYDLIGVFECTELNEDDWEKLTTRLRNGVMPYQQIIGDCNPAHPQHWLNQRCNKGLTSRIISRHEDNPTVTPKYLETLSRLTGARRARLFEGKWVAQDGLVYDGFNHAVHLIDSFPIPEGWQKFRAIDFGFTNPFVCQWWAVDPDGRLFLYREIYKTKRIVEDHARQIIALSAGETFAYNVADHDAEDRATLARYGIRTIAATKDVSRGIQLVESRLTIAKDGKPRIFVMRDALVEADAELVEAKLPTCTAQEFDCYVWPQGSDNKPKKEQPVKMYDHGLDSLRYAVFSRDTSTTTRVFQNKPAGF